MRIVVIRKLAGLVVCALSLAVLGCATPEHGAPTSDARYAQVIPDIERMVQQTMRRSRIPGLSIVISGVRGTIWEAGFGWGDDARKVPVDSNTVFSIQSMSKTFTAVGVLTAVQQGMLDLDQPFSRYLPGFRVKSIFEENPQERITLRHLLTNTAGFTHEAPAGNNFDPGQPTFDEHVASIQDTWLMFRVGERYQYSNLGIDLAGYTLEKATGRPFIQAMTERVFTPLGMTRTTMEPSVILAEPNRATGHQTATRDIPVIVPMTGAGGVYTSAHDLGIFLSAMLRAGRGEGALLTPAMFKEMDTTPNNGGYGLGIGIGRRGEDLYFNHGGGGYGFLTYMAWYPTLDIGIAVLTNSSAHDSAHVRLADSIVNLLEKEGLVTRGYSLRSLPVCGIQLGGVKDNSRYFADHLQQTAWKDEWSRFTGRYRLGLNATLLWYGKLAVSVGFPRNMFVSVKHEGKGMTVDGVPLLEVEPGLFFSLTGEALDFRSDPPTWRNIELTRG